MIGIITINYSIKQKCNTVKYSQWMFKNYYIRLVLVEKSCKNTISPKMELNETTGSFVYT